MIRIIIRENFRKKLSWVLLFCGLFVHANFLISLHTGVCDRFFHDATRDYGKGFDFFSIYQAGYNFLHGMSVYFGVREHRFGDEHLVVPYFSGFRYLPVYAYAYGAALNVFPPWLSYWSWISVVELLFLFCIFLTWKLVRNHTVFRLAASMWLLYSPYYLELYMGQQSFVTVALLFLMGYGILKNRDKLFNAAYAGSAVWKLNTLLAAPLLVRMKRFKTLIIIGLIIILTSAPYFIAVEGSFPEFASYFKHKLISDGPNSLGFWALFSVVWKRAGADPSLILPMLKMLANIFILISIIVTFLNLRYDPLKLLSMWICTYFIAYRYVWEHHYIMMLPVLVLLFLHTRDRIVIFTFIFTAIPTPFVFWNDPSLPMPQVSWSAFQDIFYHSIKIVPVMVLYAWLVGGEIRRAVRNKELLISHIWKKFWSYANAEN